MSKVLEGVLLEQLRSELRPDMAKYGGARGCGAEHMIIEIWDRILDVMDNGDKAVCLLSVDFEKAHNRMDHGHCLRQLKRSHYHPHPGTMKLVDLTFGEEPGAGAHVAAIREDYRMKVWMLFHLREAGIKGMNLFKLYASYIRSRIEYLSVAYHSLLLKGQAEAPERLHRYAVGVCFVFEVGTRTTMMTLNIETLRERRQRRVDSFIGKVAHNPRFGHWFPTREGGTMALRNLRRIQETRSRTERRHNGPLCYIKRRANELGISPSS